MRVNTQHPIPELEDSDRWLRCDEVARHLSISVRQVWRLAQESDEGSPRLAPIRFRMPGRTRPLTRWSLDEVRRFQRECAAS